MKKRRLNLTLEIEADDIEGIHFTLQHVALFPALLVKLILGKEGPGINRMILGSPQEPTQYTLSFQDRQPTDPTVEPLYLDYNMLPDHIQQQLDSISKNAGIPPKDHPSQPL